MEILTFLYMTTGFVTVFSYISQIRALLLDTTKSLSVAKSSWLIWSYTSIVAFAYALLAVSDVPLAIIAGVNCFGCLIVTSLVLYNQLVKEEGTSIMQKLRGEAEALIIETEEECA